MTGKMVAALLGVAVLAGGVGGGAGWMLGHGAGPTQTNAVIEMLSDHTDLAETCRKQGARVVVGVTEIEFNGEAEGSPPVTDATLAAIAALHINSTGPIRRVVLQGTKITDAGLAHLEAFDFLERLELINCPNLTNNGLDHLKNKTWLRSLVVSGCDQITKEGTEALKANFAKHGDRRTLLVTPR